MKIAEAILEAFGQDWKERVARAEELIELAKSTMTSNDIRFREVSGDLRPKLNYYTFKIASGPKVTMNVQKDYVEVDIDGKTQKLKTDSELVKLFSSLGSK